MECNEALVNSGEMRAATPHPLKGRRSLWRTLSESASRVTFRSLPPRHHVISGGGRLRGVSRNRTDTKQAGPPKLRLERRHPLGSPMIHSP